MKKDSKKQWIVGKEDRLFYILLIVWPVLQFCVFYIGVNLKSLTLSFQDIDVFNNTRSFTLNNIKEAFNLLTGSKTMIKRELMSLLVYAISLITGVPLGLLFSYYISRKKFGSGTFRVLLFMPSIVSSIIMVTIYKFFVDQAYPAYMEKIFGVTRQGLLENQDTRFFGIMFYSVFVSFGTSVLMYSNRMSACDPAILEACHLDGATGIKEFWYITLPHVFSTLSTFLIVGIAGIFSNQFNLFSFYGKSSPDDLQTMGYYLYVRTANAENERDYAAISAIGLLLSVVAIILTYSVRAILNKIEPKEE